MCHLNRSLEIWDEYILTRINLRSAFSWVAALVYCFNNWDGGNLFVLRFGPSKKAIKRRKRKSIGIYWSSIRYYLGTSYTSSFEPHNYSVICFSIISILLLKTQRR